MQTCVAENVDKRLMDNLLAKASTFPSHIAMGLWSFTYPGNSEDSCCGCAVLLEGCVLCLFRSEVSVMALLLVTPWTLIIELGVFGYTPVKGSGMNLWFLPLLPLPTFTKGDSGTVWLWQLFSRCSLPLCQFFLGHLQLVLFAGKVKYLSDSVELCFERLRSQRLSLSGYCFLIRTV